MKSLWPEDTEAINGLKDKMLIKQEQSSQECGSDILWNRFPFM